MEAGRRVLYRERSGWPWWLNLLLFGTVAVSLFSSAIAGGGRAVDPTGLLPILAVVGVVYLLVGGLTIALEPDRLRVGLGWGWPIRTTIALRDIETLESVEYRPLRDFGGWGVRGPRDRRIWSARGNQAVRLGLRDGRVVYIGSDEPRTLENRIRQAMAV
jgi:hypothetical protein